MGGGLVAPAARVFPGTACAALFSTLLGLIATPCAAPRMVSRLVSCLGPPSVSPRDRIHAPSMQTASRALRKGRESDGLMSRTRSAAQFRNRLRGRGPVAGAGAGQGCSAAGSTRPCSGLAARGTFKARSRCTENNPAWTYTF
ncbi:E3 Ubiquitin-Protein Ligase Trim36 [Manis pentadactyla]|nr:E3 Ubiquitin-Protein Ligase Trim36 [Manis pentadactyla]